MADNTSIEWADATWNPVTGCTKVSPGCDNCYAETLAERFRGTPGHYFENGFDVQLRPDKLDQPLRWRKPRRIFVNSMSDLFHDNISDEFIAQVFAVMARAPHHTFQVLTKRHARMRSLLSSEKFEAAVLDACDGYFEGYFELPLPNVWLGVSVEDQKWADIRIPALLATPAAVRFVSAEPLLGPVDMTMYLDPKRGVESLGKAIDWVIVGGESGPGARPMHQDWARSLRDQCVSAGVPFLFKQWGEWSPLAPLKDGVYDYQREHYIAHDGTVFLSGELALPDGPRRGEVFRMQMPRLHTTFRVGKKVAGRELDGRTWDEFPPKLSATNPEEK